jgi:hypothetical protein
MSNSSRLLTIHDIFNYDAEIAVLAHKRRSDEIMSNSRKRSRGIAMIAHDTMLAKTHML